MVVPAAATTLASAQAHAPVPLWLCAPFALLLASIALMPFLHARFWHRHYPDVAFALGTLVLGFYLIAFGSSGAHEMLHAGIEYYSFIALVGGLYVASGGILIDLRGRASPARNTLLLLTGAVLANLLGTTGASVLLIRPFMRSNRGRLRPLHVVFFIFIVSNCGGCLTPIGDPPLYLGYLKGVPFAWTIQHLWPMWLLVNGTLLAMFFVFDSLSAKRDGPIAHIEHADHHAPAQRPPFLTGTAPIVCLCLLVAGVFIDPMLKRYAGIEGIPIGATFQLIMGVLAYVLAKPSIHHANQFTFEPVKEVGFLFVGIFLTMVPALGFLRTHADTLGLETTTAYYFATGGLSAVLDNAPTYLSFLQVALGTLHLPMTPEGITSFIAGTHEITHPGAPSAKLSGVLVLEAVSLGAVFFGAMTYIGNGPNFMVRSIVDAAWAHDSANEPHARLGTRMPSFLGYALYALVFLLPVLVLNWIVFLR